MENKDIHFNHKPNHEELISAYNLSKQNDPRSVSYKRVLIRPKVNLIKPFFHILICLIFISLIGIILEVCFNILLFSIIIPIIILIIYALVRLKSIIIFFIRLYQKFAPEHIRKSCRFEPSCSEYMILSLEKYGLVKGLKKGRDRLKRCCPPNGGYDMP